MADELAQLMPQAQLAQLAPGAMPVAPPSGSDQWVADHKAREMPAGNFAALDKALGGPFSKGNINLNGRKVYVWPGKDGKPSDNFSSLESMSTNIGGKEVLLPKVTADGKMLTEEQAIQSHLKTGLHLGKFNTPEEATKHAIDLERRQNAYYINGPGRVILDQIYKRSGAP